MNTYQVTCREWSYFIKEVKANSEDEARKIHNNVNGFKMLRMDRRLGNLTW